MFSPKSGGKAEISWLEMCNKHGQSLEILSPLGQAFAAGIDLNEALRRDLNDGARQLDTLVTETRNEIESVISQVKKGSTNDLESSWRRQARWTGCG